MEPKTTFTEREMLRLSYTFRTFGVLIIALQLTSCVSYKSITETGPTTSHLKTSTSIVPGNVLRITMKDGEKIKKLKVKEADSLKISGVHHESTKRGWISVNKIIMINDTNEIKKREFSLGKTSGLIILSISLPILIVGLVYSPSIN